MIRKHLRVFAEKDNNNVFALPGFAFDDKSSQ